jgi:dihydrodipicolinate synthase/N-acetylneuraminate lyase
VIETVARATPTTTTTLLRRIVPGRRIEGISAVLLPFAADGQIDLDGFAAHLERTAAAGLTPAVNMDTGYVNVLSPAERRRVLGIVREVMAGRPFVAGAFVEGEKGDLLARYLRAIEEIRAHGGTPILFQASAFAAMTPGELVALHVAVAARCERLIIFELGQMFAPFGRIYELDLVRELIQIPQVVGMKHSSLDRGQEWARLALRDELRPDFKIYTGNDLGIDMVIYGSDYLLGLSTFAPEAFAARDALWAADDPGFFALNDLLQYLGAFAFREPVPAYKHSAAQFLRLRGRLAGDAPHPRGLCRPASDLPVLAQIAERLAGMGL